MRRLRAAFAAIAIAVPLLWAPAVHAAEVSVQEAPELMTLSFQASPGEENQVAVTLSQPGAPYMKLKVLDAGAPLVPGAGCVAVGEGSAAVECTVRTPKWSDYEPCGKGCAHPIPGTAWWLTLDVDLGDGSNAFDSSSLLTLSGPDINAEVTSGGGDDKIHLGPGEDRIDPGAGSDEVNSGEGFDRILATPVPDGPDVYESGPGLDKLSYAQRTVPTLLSAAAAGAAGEGDLLNGHFHVVGGVADDVLEGTPEELILEGGPGNDQLSGVAPRSHLYGGAGNDRLSTTGTPADAFNRLVGEEGDDVYLGGAGTDFILESEVRGDWGGRPEHVPGSGASGGDDSAYGGEGRDVFELRAGRDLAFGEGGNDSMHGGIGPDALVAGPGADQLIGGSGFDRLFGGSGSDRLFSGRWKWNTATKAETFPFTQTGDDGRDRTGCGPGRDLAFVNPWDQTRSCESLRLRPHPRRQPVRR